MALLAGLEGQHLLQTDLEGWRRRVLGSPWVEQATLRRVLPSTVEVTIRERLPIAIGRIRGDLYLVDEQGLVIDEYGPNYAQFDLPIVDGLADAGAGEPAIDPARAGLAADLLRALEQQPVLMKRISQIDVASAHDAVVLLDQDPALVHLGDEQFVATAAAVPGTARGAALARARHRVRRSPVRRPRLRAAWQVGGGAKSGRSTPMTYANHGATEDTEDAQRPIGESQEVS